MHYLDTSALVKLVFEEAESSALQAFIGADPIAISALSRTELRRVAIRAEPVLLPECKALLAQAFEVRLTLSVLDEAGVLEPARLRSLDAIHLACAGLLRSDLTSFVAYDERLAAAATAAGLPLAVPR